MADFIDYFEILGIDLDERDRNLIEQKIDAYENKLNKTQLEGRAAEAEEKREQLPEIRRVMLDDQLRAERAWETRRKRDEERDVLWKELDDRIQLIEPGDHFTEEEARKGFRKYIKGLSKAEVFKALEDRGVTVGEIPELPPTKEYLDFTTMKVIRSRLDSLPEKPADLYAFLGHDVSRQSPVTDLFERGKRGYNDLSGNQTDTIATERKHLYGDCTEIFKTKQKKQKYDNSLVAEKLDPLRELITMAGRDCIINHSELERLLHRAQGIAPDVAVDDAIGYICDVVREKDYDFTVQARRRIAEGKSKPGKSDPTSALQSISLRVLQVTFSTVSNNAFHWGVLGAVIGFLCALPLGVLLFAICEYTTKLTDGMVFADEAINQGILRLSLLSASIGALLGSTNIATEKPAFLNSELLKGKTGLLVSMMFFFFLVLSIFVSLGFSLLGGVIATLLLVFPTLFIIWIVANVLDLIWVSS